VEGGGAQPQQFETKQTLNNPVAVPEFTRCGWSLLPWQPTLGLASRAPTFLLPLTDSDANGAWKMRPAALRSVNSELPAR
jgi:hypothetical protein